MAAGWKPQPLSDSDEHIVYNLLPRLPIDRPEGVQLLEIECCTSADVLEQLVSADTENRMNSVCLGNT